MSEPRPASTDPTIVPVRQPRPRRRRGLRVLLIVLVLLAALFVVADRVSAVVADRVAASQIEKHENLDTRPSVNVHGFPFLTQVLAGRLGHVTIKLPHYVVKRDGKQLRLSDLRLELYDLTASDHFSDLKAKRGTAQAFVKYTDLSQFLHASVSFADGRLIVRRSVSILGVTFSGDVSAVATVSNGLLSFTDIRADIEGASVPAAAVRAFEEVFHTSVHVSSLPFGIELTSATATADGLRFELSGSDLSYRR